MRASFSLRVAATRALRLRLLSMVLGATLSLALDARAAPDPVEPHRATRDAVIAEFRRSGRLDLASLVSATAALREIAARSRGELQARALLELGRMQRMQNDFATASATLTRAAELAESLRLRDVAFDTWIGVARSNMLGTRDHGAAAAAFERAVDAAGTPPSSKQRFELADYQSQLLESRGEVEAALVEGLHAARLATEPADRFYAEIDIGAALFKLVSSCHHRPLRDTRSAGEGDRMGACRRAAAAGDAAYVRAARLATELGWNGLLQQVVVLRGSLGAQRLLLELGSAGPLSRLPPGLRSEQVFSPRNRRDVLVTRNFEGGGSALQDERWLADVAEQVLAESEARTGQRNARGAYMRGVISGIRGGSAKADPALLDQAARMLAAERASFFDPRRRGTVIEDSPEIIRDLALRMLALGREPEAFAAFESARARGLGELAQALASPEVTPQDRAWLAALLTLDARASEIEASVVMTLIGEEGRLKPALHGLEELEAIRAERRALLRDGQAARARLSRGSYAPANLEALRQAAAAAGIPVLLYWTDPVNITAWYVGPRGSEVRAVFLPQEILAQKVRRVAETAAESAAKPFDAAIARELYLFLIAPFEHLLDAPQVMIIPQGPLVGLPFETLVLPESGEPLVQRWAVSYAPNATMALEALRRPPARLGRMAAIVDVDLDDDTHELVGIGEAGLRPRIAYARDALPGRLGESLAGAEIAHLLLHGIFNEQEPLRSALRDSTNGGPSVFASQLIGLPLRGLRLAVLSACEGGRVGTRLSNEIYGFPWALLAGGSETVVLSRWQVKGQSNSAWMRYFYRALVGGASPAGAAATAMRGMRRDGHAHPYHWAAMQVSGR